MLDLTDNRAIPTTTLQEHCHREWKLVFASAMHNRANKGRFAFVEAGRDPTDRTLWATRSSSRHPPPINKCQCLRAAGPGIHVFALGEGTGQLSLDRNLRIRERAALQGFPAAVGNLDFTETAGRRIVGNAMAVSVVGSLLAGELKCIQETWAARAARLQPVRSDAPLALRSPVPMSLPEGVGPVTTVHNIDGQPVDDEQDAMPGLRADVVTMARDIWAAWDLGTPGRVPKRQRTVHPADQMVIAWRTVVGNPSARPRAQTSASARSGTQVAAVEPEEDDSVVGIQGWTPP